MGMERGGGEEGTSGWLWKIFEVNIVCENVGVFHSQRGRCKEDSGGRCSRTNKEYKVTGNRRLDSKGVLEQRQKKSGNRLRSPDNALCLHRNKAWHLGQKEECRKESSVNGPLKELGKLMRRWQRMISAAQELRRKS